ncbi:protein ABHD16A [Agrilus planipennis]|uniref:Protein ABHD16A n=1 Tax=Agrilus planipennis TaxID=224129 RepID=A0A1W4XSM5_AGRPL|nr:protein ABHD16A [Agrilus planipennis]
MSLLRSVIESMFTPRLVKIYGNSPLQVERVYEPNLFEKWSDQIINSIYMLWKLGLYGSPLLVGYFYRKGYLTSDYFITLTKFVTSIGVILVVSFCVRGFGRSTNSVYQKFLKTLKDADTDLTPSNKQALSRYEFDFYAWPAEYTWFNMDGIAKKARRNIVRPVSHRNAFQLISSVPCHIIGYLSIHTFGIRMIYPGSLGILQMILGPVLLQGRTKLIESYKGVRSKLKTKENNSIDTMFIDRRNETENGNTLVVCCEGNAGFYEIGVMGTPIEAGYSVLGWNHPGFACSTGKPYPVQEHNAIDIVMQFAINKLGFKKENIILFGWSIGGYTATWAAMNYPDIKAVVLDATFDDILPLAVSHMPQSMESIVKLAIREYVNLNIAEQLLTYPGPVLIIRRTEDEVICLEEGILSSNRGNNLLIKLFKYRYPLIMNDAQLKILQEYFSYTGPKQDDFYRISGVNSDLCRSLLESYISENSKSYPMRIGEDMDDNQKTQMVLYLARKYMKDYKSTHCTPLPRDMFQAPWDINIVENDFVLT